MPFSNGTYSLPTNSFAQPVSGQTISSTDATSTWADFVTAFSTCVLKDGTQTITANIPMAGFKFTGLGAGSASGNSLRYEQVNGVVTTAGDTLYATGAGTLARLAIGAAGAIPKVNSGATAPEYLAIGTANQILRVNSGATAPEWVTILTTATNSLAADVALNNTANYFTGPSCAQGTSGTWFASGTVVVQDTAGAAAFHVKLWDGTTVIAAAVCNTAAAGNTFCMSLSGYLASPAGNIRISAKDVTSTSGLLLYDTTGTAKDCTLSVVRIA